MFIALHKLAAQDYEELMATMVYDRKFIFKPQDYFDNGSNIVTGNESVDT